MYGFPEMIELGFDEHTEFKEFPSEDHKVVAQALGIGNLNIKRRNDLIDIVQAVCRVPQERIRTVTVFELINEFGLTTLIFGD